MKHEVWDVAIGKNYGSFPSMTDALDVVRALLSTNGDAYVHDLVLNTIGDEWGDSNVTGQTLLAHVRDADGPDSAHAHDWLGAETGHNHHQTAVKAD